MRVTWASLALSLPLTAAVDFDRDVKPILTAKCFSCHGSKVQQSGLRLDKRQNALRGGDYGPVIVQFKSGESKLIKRVVSGDGGMQMPPTGPLEKDEIATLRAWIDEGADFGRVEIKDEPPAKPLDPKVRAFLDAVRGRNLAGVRKALAADPALAKAYDNHGSTALHHAAGFGDEATLELLLDKGADIRAVNDRKSTPLHWAISEESKVRLLVRRGAPVDAKQVDGRSPLYQAASMGNHNGVLRFLLEKGADANAVNSTGNTPLMAAANRGDAEAMRLLIAHKANVNAVNGTGGTALHAATLGRSAESVKILVEAGADVNAMTKRKVTALANAAMQGTEDAVKLLLARGAKVNVQDDRGYSPLMYAAYSESLPAGIVRMLLAKGADKSFTGEGETAMTLAAKRGDSEVARLLGVSEADRKRGGVAVVAANAPESRPVSGAVTQALAVLEKQSHNFIRIGGCNSCHNQNLPSAAAALARDRGIAAPKSIAEMGREMREVSAERVMDLGAISVNSFGYEVFDLAMNRAPRDEYTDAMARYLKAMQAGDGSWKTPGNRPPLASDDFQTTAFSLYALANYAPQAEKADTARVMARAAAWLESGKPATTQERAFHLLGLAWSGGKAASIAAAAKALGATQRADGGWSQLPSMGSDAYATGQALYALRVAGKTPASDAVYGKGVRYLLRTQAADGSWHVKTRSLPIQPYFESGFPYGHDQWISAAGTAWASIALSLASGTQTGGNSSGGE